jgi:sugar phosphate permease
MGHNDPAEGITTTPRPAPPHAAPTWVRYQVLAAACTLAVLTYVQRQGFVGGTPFIKEALGLNDAQMGLVASIWLVAYGIFQVPGGLLGDLLGGRHVLTALVLGWSMLIGVVALTAILPPGGWLPFAFLLALRFLFGAFQAGGFPALARVLADWMPTQERGLAQGMVWTFSRLGGFVAPLLFLWLFRLLGGWAPPFWFLAGLGFIWCAVFWTWFRNRPEEMPGVNAAERELIAANRPSTAAAGPFPWLEFLTSPSVWGLCLMYGCVGFAGNFITSLLPIYLRDHRHLDDHTTAWLSGLPLAAGVVSCLCGGLLSDLIIRSTGSRKWGRRLVGCVSLALAGLAILAPLAVEHTWLLGAAFCAMFFFSDANMGPAWASCADVGERYAGTLSGAMNMTGAFAGAAGMALAGVLFHQGQDDLVFILFGCSYALASLCWLLVDVSKPLVRKDAFTER